MEPEMYYLVLELTGSSRFGFKLWISLGDVKIKIDPKFCRNLKQRIFLVCPPPLRVTASRRLKAVAKELRDNIDGREYAQI